MATFGLTYFLIGLGELIFGGNPKQMIASELYLPQGLDRLSCSAARCASSTSTSPPP